MTIPPNKKTQLSSQFFTSLTTKSKLIFSLCSFFQENIIILKVEQIRNRKMNITFVVAKDAHLRELTAKRIMNSTRIRALLIQRKNDLKNAFSGVTMNSSTISLTKLQNKIEDNTRLLTLVGLVGFFFTVTYIIAAVKVCR